MQQPSPRSYGLSQSDIASLDRWKDRILSVEIGCGIAGAICGFLLGGLSSESLGGALFGAFWGAVIASLVSGSSIEPLVGMFSSRFHEYSRFKADLKVFEVWDLRTRSEFWQSLSGRNFERELAKLFTRQGYEVELTPHSGDGGIDIILKRSGRTTVVQCKQTKHPVGPAVARELYGALIATKANDAILAAVGGVTTGVRQFFIGKPVRVMDLSEILRLQKEDAAA